MGYGPTLYGLSVCVPPKFITPMVLLEVGPLGGNQVCLRSWRWSPMLALVPYKGMKRPELSLSVLWVYNERVNI